MVNECDYKNRDVFVHFSAICPLNCQYRTLMRGEYVNFDIEAAVRQGAGEEAGIQAARVTGILGGPLMCDMALPASNGGGANSGGRQHSKALKKFGGRMYHRYHHGGPRPQHLQDGVSGTHWE